MENNVHYGPQEGANPFCLGHPPHVLHAGEVVCRICGTLAIGAQIGIYRVQKILGTGRSGQAYLAIHQRSGQPVVIKLFPYDETSTHLWDTARREVRAVTALHHSSILPIFSCTTWEAGQAASTGQSGPDWQATVDQNSYLLTLCQYIPSTLGNFVAHYQKRETQRTLYEQGITPMALLVNLIQQAGSALSAAHARGISHGALVPGNLLLTSQERIWIADFGLARLHPPAQPYLPPELYSASAASTHSGNTRAYWNAVTPASDQYMFAIICEQLFSRILPQTDYDYLLPVLQRASQQRPERRYPTIDLFVHDLLTLANSNPLYPTSPSTPERGSGKRGDKHNISTPVPAGRSAGPMTPVLHIAAANQRLAAPITPMAPITPAAPATPFTPSVPLQAEDWEKRGDKLFTMHDYEEALKAYHAALEVSNGKAPLWLALGDTYFALERYKEALMAYEQAMYLNPNDPQAWSNRGTALDALGRHHEALDCYERAEQLQ